MVLLDRPQRMNALSRAMVLALGRIGRELGAMDSVRAVVLTGVGERAFCAGADLKERLGMSDAQVLEQLELYRSELGWLGGGFRWPCRGHNGSGAGGLARMCAGLHLRFAPPGSSAWRRRPRSASSRLGGEGLALAAAVEKPSRADNARPRLSA